LRVLRRQRVEQLTHTRLCAACHGSGRCAAATGSPPAATVEAAAISASSLAERARHGPAPGATTSVGDDSRGRRRGRRTPRRRRWRRGAVGARRRGRSHPDHRPRAAFTLPARRARPPAGPAVSVFRMLLGGELPVPLREHPQREARAGSATRASCEFGRRTPRARRHDGWGADHQIVPVMRTRRRRAARLARRDRERARRRRDAAMPDLANWRRAGSQTIETGVGLAFGRERSVSTVPLAEVLLSRFGALLKLPKGRMRTSCAPPANRTAFDADDAAIAIRTLPAASRRFRSFSPGSR